MLNTAPPCHWTFCKISTFERAKQEAQLWASNAGNINMFNRVVQRHRLNRWFRNSVSQIAGKSLATIEAGSIDYWRKTAATQSETDDRRTTGSVIKQNIKNITLPLYVLTVNIQHWLFISVFLLVNILDNL